MLLLTLIVEFEAVFEPEQTGAKTVRIGAKLPYFESLEAGLRASNSLPSMYQKIEPR